MFPLPVLALWLTFPHQRFVTASGIVTPLGLSSSFAEARRAFVQAPQLLLLRVQGACASSHAKLPMSVLLNLDEVSNPKDEGISKSAKLF